MRQAGLVSISAIFLVIAFFYAAPLKMVAQGKGARLLIVSLDTLKPGDITKIQLGNIKGLHVTTKDANGQIIQLNVKSFSVTSLSFHHDPTIVLKVKGPNFLKSLLPEFDDLKPGDYIVVGDVIVEGNDKPVSLASPIWKIVSSKK